MVRKAIVSSRTVATSEELAKAAGQLVEQTVQCLRVESEALEQASVHFVVGVDPVGQLLLCLVDVVLVPVLATVR
jgi:hypothetical protein